MKKKAIILTIITIIAIGIITLGVCWRNKNVKENSNLISCGNHIDEDYKKVDFEELIEKSDIISIHAPLNERTNNLISNRKLTLLPIGIGQGADLNTLRKFSGNRGAFTLKGIQFREFFQWLSQSVSETSISSPGNEVDLFEAAKTMTSQWNSHQVAR